MPQQTTQPELKDIIEAIHRYKAANREGVFFVGFFASDKDLKSAKLDSNMYMGYGPPEVLKKILNDFKERLDRPELATQKMVNMKVVV